MSSYPSAITVSDSDEEDDTYVPSREECEARCQTFAEVTGTDSACAMFYLQEREWNLERAIDDYLQENNSAAAGQTVIHKDTESKPPQTCSGRAIVNPGSTSTPTDSSQASFLTVAAPVQQIQHDNVIRLLSWNIDGLDPDNLESRTEGACGVLMQECAELIFLQEVVHRSLAVIRARCGAHYFVYIGAEGNGETPPLDCNAYFTAMLLRKESVTVETVRVTEFPGSLMSRTCLEVKAKVKGVAMVLITSHLESTAEHSAERKRQLKTAFDRMMSLPTDTTVVFGGDLNLRDKELIGASSKPAEIKDLWECTGKRPEARYTWDLMRNDNKQLGTTYQPKCRFDRLFIRNSRPFTVKPVYFELTGIQRLTSCRRFPSDHWGILAHLNIL